MSAPTPAPAALLHAVCKELQFEHAAHTILLYGSLADGTAGAESDVDLAAFGPVATVTRAAHVRDGTFIDAFVYPEVVLESPEEEHLRLRGARILLQRGTSAEAFLERLDAKHRAGPEPLPPDELQARRVWAHKMLARSRRGDAEGNYRRAWLLTALLEDYFHLRGLWYEGPKKAMAWLRLNDPGTSEAFEQALRPAAQLATIAAAVVAVAGRSRSDPASSDHASP